MRILTIVFTYIFISELSAYSIKQIQGIGHHLVTNVNFDAEGNTYVVASSTGDTDYRFYKLNASNEILSTTDLPYYVSETFVSKRGDSYFHFFHDDNRTLGIVRANSTKVELISEMYFELFHLDNEGNLYYCQEAGVYVLKSGSSASVLITNLEDYISLPSGISISDRLGNTYIPVHSGNNISFAVITKEALQEENPYATFIYPFDNPSYIVEDLKIDEDDNLWISAVDSIQGGVIKRLVNGNWETVLTDPDRQYNTMVPTKEKTYIIASDTGITVNRIYYIASTGEVVETPELQNLTSSYFSTEALADTEGQVYFTDTIGDELSSSLGRMVTIKPNELKPIPIALPNNTESLTMYETKLDFNNDVWILDSLKAVYNLKKGETVPDLLNDPNEMCFYYWGVDVNFITENIYVSCASGLFIVTND